MRIFVFLFLVMFSLQGCEKNCACNGEVNIRVINRSAYDFKGVVVGNHDFEDLQSGASSFYQVFEKAYRYNYIKVAVNGQDYVLQPIDFVGETPLKPGFYSYSLNIEQLGDPYGSLLLTFVDEN